MAPRTVHNDAKAVGEIAAKIDAIVGVLREVEAALRNPLPHQPKTISMTVDKADNFIEHLEGWAQGIKRKKDRMVRKAKKAGRPKRPSSVDEN